MNAAAIAIRAQNDASQRSPDSTIRRALRAEGFRDDWSDIEFRTAYLECERAWRQCFAEAAKRPATCAGRDCETPLQPYQRKWCSRDCWSRARAKTGGVSNAARDAEIVRLRKDEDLTLQAIADRFDLSWARVHQILRARAA